MGLILSGECNRCGLCCAQTIKGTRYACTHLAVGGSLGQPNASRCTVYADRYDQMPIVMRNEAGEELIGRCFQDSPEENDVILMRGIGLGCSLELVGHENP